ncbi:MAG: tetratricopeptide repeat-containing sensor histidine kinase [Bacteroidota bacterium]
MLFLFLLSHLGMGQQRDIDSLRSLLPSASDTTRIQLFFELSMKYENNLSDSAEYFARMAVEQGREIGYTKGEADGLISLGRIIRDKGQLVEGLELLSASLELYRTLHDLQQIGHAYNDISIVYAMSDDYEKSLEFFLKALATFEEASDMQGVSYALNNIGIVYQELGQDSLARDYFVRSLNIKEKNDDTYGVAQAYVNLANVFKDYELVDQALLYHFKADSAFSIIDNKRGEVRNLVYIADIYTTKNQLQKAWDYVWEAYQKANKYEAILFKQDALQTMVRVRETMGDYAMALTYQKEYQQIADSLNNEKQITALEELKTEFSLAEKDLEIELLKKEQIIEQARNERQRFANYLLIAGVLFMVITACLLGWAYLNNRRKNAALTDLNKEKDQLISILSHDFKGPLNTLKGFLSLTLSSEHQLSVEEKKVFGGKISESIGHLLSLIDSILEWYYSKEKGDENDHEKIIIHEVVEQVIKIYELMAYEKKLNLRNEVDQLHILYSNKKALSTVLRNLLSNAIKFSHIDGVIRFHSEHVDDTVVIMVSDTGMGIAKKDFSNLFDFSKRKVRKGTTNEMGSGMGLALSKELVETNGGQLEVESQEGKGSCFKITLPKSSVH